MASAPSLPGQLVSTEWLADHLDDTGLIIVDSGVHLVPPAHAGEDWTQATGKPEYLEGHIPGTVFADLIDDFSDPGGWFTNPSPERFADAAGALGIAPDTAVVIYSGTAGVFWATRLWWLLRANGFTNAAVLDGGIDKWKGEGRLTRSGYETNEPVTFVGTPAPRLIADKREVLELVQNGEGACLINALAPSDHHATDSISYARPGRIPGSTNVFVATLLNREDGTFKSPDELRELFHDVLERPGRKVTYCGGGIAATGDAFALTLLGEDDVAIYDGSLREWANDPSLPLEVG